jgi:MFS family permease
VIAIRLLEGVGAGFFVAASMSYVNSFVNHERMSGYFMASLNTGLVIGLILAGWLAAHTPDPATGIILFAGLSMIPAAASFFVQEPSAVTPKGDYRALRSLLKDYRWLWYSSVILIGITGVITSLYPRFSGYSPDSVGIWISLMSISTVIAVLVASRLSLTPVFTIRYCAFLMVIAVGISFYSPLGFIILGTLAGFVMIAQMSFLAKAKDHQGIAMGLFSTSTYLGMTALPVITGVIADLAGFFYAFCVTALFAVTVFLTIEQCECRLQRTL